jgi:hypothetical protein
VGPIGIGKVDQFGVEAAGGSMRYQAGSIVERPSPGLFGLRLKGILPEQLAGRIKGIERAVVACEVDRAVGADDGR